MHLNTELLLLAVRLGRVFSARVTNWGRDEDGNQQMGGHPKSWHLWKRGANAIDMTTSDLDNDGNPDEQVLELMAREARDCGYEAVVYPTHVHIEVPW